MSRARKDRAWLEQRDFLIRAARSGGTTLEAIAQELGVTRERIRQLVARMGDERLSRNDPLAIVAAAKKSTSVLATARCLGVSPSAVTRCLNALGMLSEVRAMWKQEQLQVRRDRLVAEYRAFSKSLGHAASIKDLTGPDKPFCHTDAYDVFGSLGALQIAAGYEATLVGGAGHRRQRTRCMRGHDFVPENTKIAGRKKVRVCRSCDRARRLGYRIAKRNRDKAIA